MRAVHKLAFQGKVAGLATASAVLLLAAVLSYLVLVRQLEDHEWIIHTHTVLEKLGEVRSNVTEVEAGERGYLITGDDVYLPPYDRGARDLRPNPNALRPLALAHSKHQPASNH